MSSATATVAASAVTNGSGTAGTIGSAGSYAASDIGFVTITWQSGSAMTAAPAGYTALPDSTTTGTGNLKIWQGYCVGTPSATTFTLGGTVRWTAIICRISNTDTTAPVAINSYGATTALDTSSTSHAVTGESVTTTGDNQLVLNTFALRISSTTGTPTVSSWAAVTSNTTEDSTVATAVNLNAVGTLLTSEVKASAGATTVRTGTATINAAARCYKIASSVSFVNAVATKTNDISWDVRSKASKTNDIRWDVKSKASKTNDIRWDVKSKASKTNDIRWNIRSKTSKTNDIQWNVRSKFSKTNDIRWNIRSKALKTNDIRWDIRSKASKTSNIQWNVLFGVILTPVAKTLDVRWNVRFITAKTNNIQWNVRFITAKTNNIQWNVRSKASKTSNIQWNIRSKIAKTNDIRWNIRVIVAKTNDIRWNVLFGVILTPVAKTLDVRWNIRQPIRKYFNFFWFISTPTIQWVENGVQYRPNWGVVFVPVEIQEEYTFGSLAAYIISDLNTWNNPIVGQNTKPFEWSESGVNPSSGWVEF